MDIERIQKINNLALDLMKQGLAVDREEAIAQAEKVFQNKDLEDYTSIKETMQNINKENQKEKDQVAGKSSTEDLSSENIKVILEKNTQFLIKKIREFQSKVELMGKEMEMMKNYLRSQPTVQEMAAHHAQQVQQQQPVPAAQPPKQSTHPRSGRYEQEDVSIEKFFYSGGNK